MIQEIKSILKASLLFVGGSLMLLSCESDPDNLGSQFFEGSGAEGVKVSKDVIAYNISNNDSIRSDASRLTYATLGAFTEPQFGMQKSSFVSQVRLSTYDPDFGTNAVVDSVVMVLKPLYASDSATTTTDEAYIYPTGNVAAKKVVTTYPVTKYGKSKLNGKTTFTINVNQVDDFLGGTSDIVYSNKFVNYSTLLGTTTFSGDVRSVKITKDTDNSELYTKDADIRIPLDKNYFQTMLVAKKGQPELLNASNFIRYMKGMRISVAENDGYIMKLNPDQTSIIMYYKRDVTSNGTTAPSQTTFNLTLGSSGAHFNQIDYNRTQPFLDAIANSNSTTGDAKIYAQGMGGPNFGLKIPDATVQELRTLYSTEKVGILSAKIRLYTDVSTWNNNYEKPSYFTVQQKDMNQFLSDMSTFAMSGVYSLVKTGLDTDKTTYYDISITDTFRNIIEKNADNKDLILTVANYEVNSSTQSYVGYNYTTRSYTPNRIILIGTDAANPKRAQLNIIYAKK